MKKYYGIEALRLFTSLSVLLYHYRHFFGPSNTETTINYDVSKFDLPFYSLLDVFYNNGFFGVNVFYTISGFVFAHVYLSVNKKIKFKEFFINRFARLYPLHFATLVIVLFLQLIHLSQSNSFQIYIFNDFYHFILNLLFISSWGLEEGYSFNGPIWSISIEIIIYFLFFITLTLIKKYRLNLIIIVSIFFIIADNVLDTESLIFICARLFFSGVLIFMISEKIKKKYYLLAFPCTLTLVIFSFVGNFKIYLFCPSVVMLFILMDVMIKKNDVKLFLKSCGNLTYALYLLHIPTQLFLLLLGNYFNLSNYLYLNLYFFIFYFIIMISISKLSFNFFEKPLNKKIRNNFNR